MKALFWSAVLNGVAAVPLMLAIMILSCKSSVMGTHVASPSMKFFGWLATIFMAGAAIYMFIAWIWLS
jgi:Mn2+/Fe2+ NRAMP family transporter